MRNLRWLLSQQAIRLVAGFFVGSWMARVLGPEGFGKIGAAHSLACLAYVAVELGWRPMVLKEMGARPRIAHLIAGTTFWLWSISAVLAIAAAAAWNHLRGTQIPWAVFAAAMVALAVFPFTLHGMWEEAEQRPFVNARNLTAAYMGGLLLRIGALLYWPRLPVIAWTIGAEPLLHAGLSAWIGLRRKRGALLTAWSSRIAKVFLSRTGWLALYQIANMLILRLDLLLLHHLKGDAQTGLYTASTRLCEIGTSASAMLTAILLPVMAKLIGQNASHATIQDQSRRSMNLLATAGLLATSGLYFVGPVVLTLLFGQKYVGAISVLSIHCISIIAYFLWDWRNSLLIYQGQLRSVALLAGSGAVLNVWLNLWLIPSHGPTGAAAATVIAYLIAGVVFTALLPQHRWLAKQQLSSLLTPLRLLISPRQIWPELRQTLQS
jgi:O-antigen/teichoic acid export membrane protein